MTGWQIVIGRGNGRYERKAFDVSVCHMHPIPDAGKAKPILPAKLHFVLLPSRRSIRRILKREQGSDAALIEVCCRTDRHPENERFESLESLITIGPLPAIAAFCGVLV
jgi:hypothetical protein